MTGKMKGPGLCLGLLLAAGPGAADSDAALRCAAFWQASADIRRGSPGYGISPATSEALADDFRARITTPDDAAFAREREGFRLLHRGVFRGDRQSRDLAERIAARCDGLLRAE
ncbi:hypothetical protein K7H20_19925 [Salipiger manganoxidans]|uniref:hypothetical protein n=1 Tax=Salipiger marinus TaxID=555512 RepID=UPI001E5FA514|nr:hypothetical protein [Salipiger manganoxidans]MCD1620332.1 hypothetical protein [Salipiger manganoxidans]